LSKQRSLALIRGSFERAQWALNVLCYKYSVTGLVSKSVSALASVHPQSRMRHGVPSGAIAQAVAAVVEAPHQLFMRALSRPHINHIMWPPRCAAVCVDTATMTTCSIICGQVHRYPMPSGAWCSETWSWPKRTSTEKPLCRLCKTRKADMVVLSSYDTNVLHSWWRWLMVQKGYLRLTF
jgi:hypothetical protein